MLTRCRTGAGFQRVARFARKVSVSISVLVVRCRVAPFILTNATIRPKLPRYNLQSVCPNPPAIPYNPCNLPRALSTAAHIYTVYPHQPAPSPLALLLFPSASPRHTGCRQKMTHAQPVFSCTAAPCDAWLCVVDTRFAVCEDSPTGGAPAA